MNLRTLILVGLLGGVSFPLTACYIEPLDEEGTLQHDEIPPGPGLFTGSEGAIVIGNWFPTSGSENAFELWLNGVWGSLRTAPFFFLIKPVTCVIVL